MSRNIHPTLMLLSADWFLAVEPQIGFNSPESARRELMEKCRALVQSLFEAQLDFYSLDRSSAGMAQLAVQLATFMDQVHLTQADKGKVKALLGPESEEHERLLTVIAGLTDQFASEGFQRFRASLPADVIDRIIGSYKALIFRHVVFERCQQESSSAWDKWLQTADPDLPFLLAHFAQEALEMGVYIVFISSIVETLNAEELENMSAVYNAAMPRSANISDVTPFFQSFF